MLKVYITVENEDGNKIERTIKIHKDILLPDPDVNEIINDMVDSLTKEF